MKNQIDNVYILLAEEPGDFTMEPKAVVIVMKNGHFRVYSVRADHNRLRTLVNRNSFSELEKGLQHQGSHYRLERKTSEVSEKGWTAAESIPEILTWLRALYARHLFFLDNYIEALSQ